MEMHLTKEQIPYKIKDISLASFGRLEIEVAEKEMPGSGVTAHPFW
jgi:S-adenosylhomocysteine hydrolase